MKQLKTYVVSILIPLLVGGFSAFLTRGNMMLYDEIIKPPFAPPTILFPIVWTILYILMGIGAARVYLKRDIMPKEASKARTIYFLQLAVNFFWSLIFFNQRAFLAAFLWLVILWVLIILMLVKFRKVDLPAALINIPYLLWVTFAGYLTLAIYLLNR
ncbi:MAG: tryptophan-rich sensory protein [Clostridia bacterium]|nr:tryptophan-rich sensory protein [Clostridia bacterium]